MLSTLIWLPVLGAALIGLYPRALSVKRSYFIAWLTAGLTFLWSIILVFQFDFQNPGLQFQEYFNWIAPLGLDYQLGVDGLSLPLVVLTGLLVWIAIQSSERDFLEKPAASASTEQTKQPYRLFYVLVLLLCAALMGAFLAHNLLLFFLFYEIELVPLYLLILLWGGERRGYAATKFLLYQALSGVILLAGFLSWAWFSGSSSFANAALKSKACVAGNADCWVWYQNAAGAISYLVTGCVCGGIYPSFSIAGWRRVEVRRVWTIAVWAELVSGCVDGGCTLVKCSSSDYGALWFAGSNCPN
jgi:NADH:ubiquinone oxidoreductase subunit 4 (subunit M)